MKFTELSVLEKSNLPEKIQLDGFLIEFVDGTTVSLDDQWVEIVGPESESFKEADLSVRRDILSGKQLTQLEIDERIKSSLIVNWSFDEPCTDDNKQAAFKIWPRNLINYIIKKAEGRVTANFTKPKSKNLKPTL